MAGSSGLVALDQGSCDIAWSIVGRWRRGHRPQVVSDDRVSEVSQTLLLDLLAAPRLLCIERAAFAAPRWV